MERKGLDPHDGGVSALNMFKIYWLCSVFLKYDVPEAGSYLLFSQSRSCTSDAKE